MFLLTKLGCLFVVVDGSCENAIRGDGTSPKDARRSKDLFIRDFSLFAPEVIHLSPVIV
jgi:hypothetical protein